MVNYPSSLDALSNPTGTSQMDTTDHALQHSNANDILEALEAKVGIDSSAVTTSHDYKLSGVTGSDKAVSLTGTEVLTNKTHTSPVLNTAISGTAFLDEDNMASDSATKLASQQSIKAYADSIITTIYPVGSIYMSINSTNPGTVLGVGTWVAFGEGKMLISLDSGDTDFDTSEETGGAKTATIAQANLPNISTGAGTAHTHTQDAHQHSTGGFYTAGGSGSTNYSASSPVQNKAARNTDNATATNQNESAHTHSLGGSGTAMSIMPPYIAVYMFKRTV